jgi:hypothetical protein
MCHHVHAADQRDLHLALPQTNDHSTVPGPVIASSLLPIAAKICADQSHNARDQAIQFQAAKLRREFARNREQQKILLGAPSTSQIEEGVSVHNGGTACSYQAIFVPSTALASPGDDGQPARIFIHRRA